MDNSTNNKNIFQSELPCEKKNGHSIIQEFINNYPYGVQDLIKLLECGYQITYEDRQVSGDYQRLAYIINDYQGVHFERLSF